MNNKRIGVLVQVWDPLIRIGHWLIVSGFFVAYILEDEKLKVHVWAGYTVGVVLVIRILWGLVGPQNARFIDFMYKPRTILKYLVDLPRGRSRRYLDHSPAGGAMIFLLVAGLAVISVSGLMVYAYEENAGPMSLIIGAAPDVVGTESRESDFEEREDFWEELHELAANTTLALVFLHILGVVIASRVHRENLVVSMITGKKSVTRRDMANH